MNSTISFICQVAVCGFLILLEATILMYIWTGRINLNRLISEPTGDASMSRFQFLIFTFVIAISFFAVVMAKGTPAFPAEVPNGVLALLGISGSSYLVSKGIQFSNPDTRIDPTKPPPVVAPLTNLAAGTTPPPPGATTIPAP